MTDREIATHYRQALDPTADVQVMAELCATTREEIQAALARAGEIPSAAEREAEMRRL